MKRRRFLTVTVGVMVLSVGLVLASYGGSVTPAVAAEPVSLDPHAGLPQNWDQVLPAATRFVVLQAFANAAVRDNETGLVWEHTPAMTFNSWYTGRYACINKNVGGRKGWRLPSLPELASLVDPSVDSPGPTLTPGHPFLAVQSGGYWSASTNAENPTLAWFAEFFSGGVDTSFKTDIHRVWCVRGAMDADQY
jgi:hypothetical protein